MSFCYYFCRRSFNFSYYFCRSLFSRRCFNFCCRSLFSCRLYSRCCFCSYFNSLIIFYLDEFTISARRTISLTPFNTSIGNRFYVQLNCAYRIIVTWDYGSDAVRVAIGVNDTNHWYLQIVRLSNSNTFVIYVDYEYRVRQATHILNTTDTALKLFLNASSHKGFFLAQTAQCAICFLLLKIFEALNRATNSLVVSQHTTEPAMIYIRHSCALCFLLNDFVSRSLRADKKDFSFPFSKIGNFFKCGIERGNGVLEIDDVNFVSGAKYIGSHFWVPIATLVSKMYSCTEHIFHTYSHVVSFGLG